MQDEQGQRKINNWEGAHIYVKMKLIMQSMCPPPPVIDFLQLQEINRTLLVLNFFFSPL